MVEGLSEYSKCTTVNDRYGTVNKAHITAVYALL